MKIISQTNLYLLLLVFAFILPNQCWAKAISAVQKHALEQHRSAPKVKTNILKNCKSKKEFQKKRHKTTHKGDAHWLIWALVTWYVIAIAMLIIGLVMAIPPLWIVAIVMLALPIVAAIVLGIVFLIALLTSSWEC